MKLYVFETQFMYPAASRNVEAVQVFTEWLLHNGTLNDHPCLIVWDK